MSKDYFEGRLAQWTNSELMDEYTQLSDSKLYDERQVVRRAIVDRMNGTTFHAYDESRS